MILHLETLEDGSLAMQFEGRVDYLITALTLAADQDPTIALGIEEASKWIVEKRTQNPVILN